MRTMVLAALLLGLGPALAAEDVALPTVDYANTRYSTLDQITPETVGRLKVAWTFSTGVLRGHEGAPLVVGHIMYVHTPFPNTVYALDLDQDGKILWRYAPRQDSAVVAVMCCDTVHRGLAYKDGRVFLQLADTSVVALDAETGRVLWSARNGDPARGETNTAAVLPVRDRLIVGLSGGEYGARCHVTAYDQATGRRLWRAFATGPDAEMLVDPDKTTELGRPIGQDSSLKSWDGEQWKTGGGCAWGWFSYDPELNLVYYGTGNPSTWNPVQRPGDNRWAMAIVARDADTGMARWVYQMTPHDQWDYDGVNEMILTEQEIDGRRRRPAHPFRPQRLRLHPRPGDRRVAGGGKIRSERELGQADRARSRLPGLWPPCGGRALRAGHDRRGRDRVRHLPRGPRRQEPAACRLLARDRPVLRADQPHVHGLRAVPRDLYAGSALCRRDADAASAAGHRPDRRLHRVGQPFGPDHMVDPGAVLGLVGGTRHRGRVVFYGTLEGYLKAVDAVTGKELYRFKTPSGIVGNVTTYMHGGRQYVAVLSGIGGWAGIGLAAGLTDPAEGSGAVGGYAALSHYTAAGGQLTVFALPER